MLQTTDEDATKAITVNVSDVIMILSRNGGFVTTPL
jgi:hypothetical protein